MLTIPKMIENVWYYKHIFLTTKTLQCVIIIFKYSKRVWAWFAGFAGGGGWDGLGLERE